MLDGTLCEACGVALPGEPQGHPRYCSEVCRDARNGPAGSIANEQYMVGCGKCEYRDGDQCAKLKRCLYRNHEGRYIRIGGCEKIECRPEQPAERLARIEAELQCADNNVTERYDGWPICGYTQADEAEVEAEAEAAAQT